MRFLAVASALGLASTAWAQVAKYCPQDESDVCYSVNVPANTASSGNGDIYFQIQGPSSKQWIALGQGDSMSGSNMFIIYADSSGSNVTLSPRLGKGEVMPDYDKDAQVTLLDGSGIANGKMTANVRCSNCAKWSGGSMNLKSSQSSWIWAVKDGSAIKSNSPSFNIQQHNDMDSFSLDLSKGSGGNSLNPFVSQAATTTAAGGASPTTASSSQGGSGNYGGGSGSSGSSTGGSNGSASSQGSGGSEEGESSLFQKLNRAAEAHGILMGLAFVVFMPAGAIMIRLLSFTGLVWVHAVTQVFAYLMAIAGLGLGVYIATNPPQAKQISQYHPIIGIVVVSLLVVQPFLGLAHHKIYKSQHRRTMWATAHVWLGRIVITLAIINGGLGLKLSANTKKGEIAYGVVAGLVWVTWVAVIALSYLRNGRQMTNAGEKRVGSDEGSHEGSPEPRYH